MRKIIYTILIISLMILIFILSNQSADESNITSGTFIDKTVINIYKLFNSNASDEDIENVTFLVTPIVRKLAHFTLYFILGILICLLLTEYNITYKNIIITSICICVLYACSDEIHQLFVVGRSCELGDVLIDSCGSFIGIILISKLKHIKE